MKYVTVLTKTGERTHLSKGGFRSIGLVHKCINDLKLVSENL